jgi:hypothetical protein
MFIDTDKEQLFHILHDPSFHAEYASFLQNPDSVSLSWLATLFVILSLAVTSLEPDDPVLGDLARGPNLYINARALGRRYREAAMDCLAKKGILWGKHDIRSLQALILLGYAMGHSQEPTWVLLGESTSVSKAFFKWTPTHTHSRGDVQCRYRTWMPC